MWLFTSFNLGLKLGEDSLHYASTGSATCVLLANTAQNRYIGKKIFNQTPRIVGISYLIDSETESFPSYLLSR